MISVTELNQFIAEWQKIGYTPRDTDEDVFTLESNASDFERFFTQITPAFERYSQSIEQKRALGSEINLFTLLGLELDEVKNCKVLAWLFDYHGSHGQKNRILLTYLELLIHKYPDHPFLNRSLINAIQTSDDYMTSVEVHYDLDDKTQTNRRFDIQISNSQFFVVFEVKIMAGLSSKDQLTTYTNLANEFSRNRAGLLIFLTRYPYSLAATTQEDDQILIASTWRDIQVSLDNVIKSLPVSVASQTIQQFIQHIDNFY